MSYVLVVDFGSQYTHLICKRIRKLRRNCRIIPWYELDNLANMDFGTLILSGGPKSVYEEDAPLLSLDFIKRVISLGITILGICYGHQLLGKLFRGEIRRGEVGEYGPTKFYVTSDSPLFKGLPKSFTVWMNHSDVIVRPPEGFRVIGRTENFEVAAMESNEKIFGVQFHPEVRHTEYGVKIIENFLEVANLKPIRAMSNILDEKMREIREQVGDKNVVVAVSGGVDSTVLAVLLSRAIRGRVYAVTIDTGFMRKNEVDNTVRELKSLGIEHVIKIDASEKFISALIGVRDPEEKRRRFAKIYSEVLQSAIKEIQSTDPKLEYFAQGTIYPDVVESGKGGVLKDKIKSHHNVVMPKIPNLKTIEPFWDLYKDEVRELGRLLGIPDYIIEKKPFPGPGLLIRILGEITLEKINIIRRAHEIVEEIIKDYPKKKDIWQVFPVLLDSKSTGVKGDKRSYGYIVAIRVIESEDGMTAKVHEMPYGVLKKIATRIIGEIHEVTRVLYDITDKPPATIEYE